MAIPYKPHARSNKHRCASSDGSSWPLQIPDAPFRRNTWLLWKPLEPAVGVAASGGRRLWSCLSCTNSTAPHTGMAFHPSCVCPGNGVVHALLLTPNPLDDTYNLHHRSFHPSFSSFHIDFSFYRMLSLCPQRDYDSHDLPPFTFLPLTSSR